MPKRSQGSTISLSKPTFCAALAGTAAYFFCHACIAALHLDIQACCLSSHAATGFPHISKPSTSAVAQQHHRRPQRPPPPPRAPPLAMPLLPLNAGRVVGMLGRVVGTYGRVVGMLGLVVG
jgi:hypothetical protein